MPDIEISPGEEIINTPETKPEPEVVTPEVEAEASAEATEGDKPEDEADKALKRMQRRIDKRTGDFHRVRGENESLKARLADLQAKSGLEDNPREQTDPHALAREIAQRDRFAEKANSIVDAGSKAHPDYMVALKDLAREVGDFVKPNGLPSEFMEVVMDVADNPSGLLYHLGKNPDLAEELSDLSPFKLAKRLDRIEREMADKSKPKPSSAPKPLEPVRAKASESGLSSDIPIEDWMKRREKELREKRGY
jgi:hypothetical protein